MPVPCIRASAVKDSLEFLDTFARGSRAKVLAAVPADVRERIDDAGRTAWISIEDDHHTVDAIVTHFGVERAIEYWTENLRSLAEKPLLKTFFFGMLTVVGGDPERVLALLPKGWPLVYRDMGTPRFVKRGSRMQPAIVFDDVPVEVRRYRNYFHSWHGVCRAFASIAKLEGTVTFDVGTHGSSAEASFGR